MHPFEALLVGVAPCVSSPEEPSGSTKKHVNLLLSSIQFGMSRQYPRIPASTDSTHGYLPPRPEVHEAGGGGFPIPCLTCCSARCWNGGGPCAGAAAASLFGVHCRLSVWLCDRGHVLQGSAVCRPVISARQRHRMRTAGPQQALKRPRAPQGSIASGYRV